MSLHFNRFHTNVELPANYSIGKKKKFNINDNPEIINYSHVPKNDWAIINTKAINKKSDNIIFLNYPGTEKKIKLYKIRKNLYEFKDVEFYKDKFSKIKKIGINSNNILKKDFIMAKAF